MQAQTLRTTRFCSKDDRYLFPSAFYIFNRADVWISQAVLSAFHGESPSSICCLRGETVYIKTKAQSFYCEIQFPQSMYFCATIERLRKVACGVQSQFPNVNTVEGPQDLKQQKTVVTILCSEKSNVMTHLLVRLSIIDYVIKNTFVNQLILVWTLI